MNDGQQGLPSNSQLKMAQELLSRLEDIGTFCDKAFNPITAEKFMRQRHVMVVDNSHAPFRFCYFIDPITNERHSYQDL